MANELTTEQVASIKGRLFELERELAATQNWSRRAELHALVAEAQELLRAGFWPREEVAA